MTRFLFRWLINAVALLAAIWLVKGIEFAGGWISILWLALIFGLINALVRPLLKFLSFPLIVLTLGLFSLVINTFLLWLTSQVGGVFGLDLVILDPVFWNALLGALVISIVSVVLSAVFKDELKRKKHK